MTKYFVFHSHVNTFNYTTDDKSLPQLLIKRNLNSFALVKALVSMKVSGLVVAKSAHLAVVKALHSDSERH